MKTFLPGTRQIAGCLHVSAFLLAISGVLTDGVLGGALVGTALILASYGGQAATWNEIEESAK